METLAYARETSQVSYGRLIAGGFVLLVYPLLLMILLWCVLPVMQAVRFFVFDADPDSFTAGFVCYGALFRCLATIAAVFLFRGVLRPAATWKGLVCLFIAAGQLVIAAVLVSRYVSNPSPWLPPEPVPELAIADYAVTGCLAIAGVLFMWKVARRAERRLAAWLFLGGFAIAAALSFGLGAAEAGQWLADKYPYFDPDTVDRMTRWQSIATGAEPFVHTALCCAVSVWGLRRFFA